MSRSVRMLLWFGVIATVAKQILTFVLGLLTPGYSALRDFKSELGAIDAPYSEIMSVYGMILPGLLIALASVALFQVFTDRRLGTLSAALVLTYGLGLTLAGFTPCDPGCIDVEPSLRMELHRLGGLLGMGGGAFAVLAYGLGGLKTHPKQWLDRLGLVLGIIGTMAFVVFSIGVLARSPALAGWYGGIQRVIVGSADVWLLCVCWWNLNRVRG